MAMGKGVLGIWGLEKHDEPIPFGCCELEYGSYERQFPQVVCAV